MKKFWAKKDGEEERKAPKEESETVFGGKQKKTSTFGQGAGQMKETLLSLGKGKKIPLPRTKKGRAALGAGCLAILLAGGFMLQSVFSAQEQTVAYEDYTVELGNVEESISGSGTIEAAATYEVVSLVKGEVLSDTFEEGDLVEEDQLLYVIDSSDTETSVQRAQISLEKARDAYQESQETVSELNISAPISGRVGELSVEEGDDVQNGAVIATIYDDSSLEVTVPFTSADAQSLYTGQPVTVTLGDTFEQLSGTITKISNAQQILDGYVSGTNVTVSVSNPGLLQEGTYATVTAGEVSSYGSGKLEYTRSENVRATSSATVKQIRYSQGEQVSAGATIMTLESDSAQSSLKDSKRSYEDALLSYENTLEELEDYNITAPIRGTIISKDVKAGDTIDNSNSTVVMATIADMSSMSFEISVDELDVSKMEAGQSVRVTADALEAETFTGTVTNVSLLGTSSNGVTTYPVTITLDEIPEGLWPGMNVTGEIVVESAYDTPVIPLTAVSRGDLVLTPQDSQLAKRTEE